MYCCIWEQHAVVVEHMIRTAVQQQFWKGVVLRGWRVFQCLRSQRSLRCMPMKMVMYTSLGLLWAVLAATLSTGAIITYMLSSVQYVAHICISCCPWKWLFCRISLCFDTLLISAMLCSARRWNLKVVFLSVIVKRVHKSNRLFSNNAHIV